MRRNKERPNRIVEINWVQWKLNRVIDKTATDLHHIMGQCNRWLYNVNIDQNKIRMDRRKHVALNNFFGNKQNPREQLKDVFEIVKTVLTPWVRRELYTILYETDDEMFYIDELLKHKKKKKDLSKKDNNGELQISESDKGNEV